MQRSTSVGNLTGSYEQSIKTSSSMKTCTVDKVRKWCNYVTRDWITSGNIWIFATVWRLTEVSYETFLLPCVLINKGQLKASQVEKSSGPLFHWRRELRLRQWKKIGYNRNYRKIRRLLWNLTQKRKNNSIIYWGLVNWNPLLVVFNSPSFSCRK